MAKQAVFAAEIPRKVLTREFRSV